ncbi:MAG TPA: hypothetical protein PLA49_14295 [Propioniciclava sp.]|uniref:McrC family protein n=1 Tax=Propioniciclava sp. TaxID=2038686 RepID=UPI002BC950D4|nr:hypothetical protein [Propioniciclava sp.]HRL50528.1 hypothetical protein [Propioniciclava sp.]
MSGDAGEPVVYQVAEYQQIEAALTDDAARRLQGIAGPRLTLSPSPQGYRIRASSYVGSISAPGVVVHIVPKVPLDNVLHLLTWSTERIAFGTDTVGHAKGGLTGAVAAWYVRVLERALMLGIDRSYIEEADRLVALRGRIDWPAHARGVGLPTPIPCRYDEWSLDTRANRIVAAAARVLVRHRAVPQASAFVLRRLLGRLEGVGPLRSDDLGGAERFLTRLNEHYAGAVRLARLVLHAAGPAHGAGGAAVSAFLVDMNDAFEDFVFASLQQRLRGRWGVVKRCVPLDVDSHVRSEPDLLFTDTSGVNVLVADCTYKIAHGGRGRTPDYYQLLAYCTALGLPRGVLVYCDAGGATTAPPRAIEVRLAGTRLETFPVHLGGSIADIDGQLDRLADHLYLTGSTTIDPS